MNKLPDFSVRLSSIRPIAILLLIAADAAWYIDGMQSPIMRNMAGTMGWRYLQKNTTGVGVKGYYHYTSASDKILIF